MTPAASRRSPPSRSAAVSLSQALFALALDQLEQADRHWRRVQRHPHAAIHESRKALRRFRSLLALGIGVPPDLTDVLDRQARRLGRGLSRLRDAHVLAVARMPADGATAAAWKSLREHLVQRRDAIVREMLAQDPAFARRRRQLASLATRMRRGSPPDGVAVDFHAALKKSAARVRRAEKGALVAKTTADFHRWRRRARRLRMQVQLLGGLMQEKSVPSQTRLAAKRLLRDASPHLPKEKRLVALTDALGKQQDLHLLRAFLRRRREFPHRLALLRGVSERLRRLAPAV
ncbi:CHAD domain-containing protein [Tahibacter amnicola]|uniref:CHAD domain-containing protein n=1 Tax=Tahibacter amnicola TaxID=2976241 RepID=A0ABY6BJC5_9GAMM|nr:CHAD domain-containing protein [Tahibacter amnicola]UXI69691.1 CHAD domain-containing protein [Tahibacter amnicola]